MQYLKQIQQLLESRQAENGLLAWQMLQSLLQMEALEGLQFIDQYYFEQLSTARKYSYPIGRIFLEAGIRITFSNHYQATQGVNAFMKIYDNQEHGKFYEATKHLMDVDMGNEESIPNYSRYSSIHQSFIEEALPSVLQILQPKS